jgi:hypothetical protein
MQIIGGFEEIGLNRLARINITRVEEIWEDCLTALVCL